MSRGSLWTHERKAKLLDLYRSGSTRSEMAEYFGVPLNAINGALWRLNKRGGVSANEQPKETVERRIIAYYDSGRTIGQIAHSLGITRVEVESVLVSHGRDIEEEPQKYSPVDQIWGWDEDARRRAIARRAAKGARAALKAMGAA